MKKCSCCQEHKEYSHFHKNKTQKDGYKNQCKSCIKIGGEKYRKNNKDSIREYMTNNKDRIKEQQKDYRFKNSIKIKDKQKLWRDTQQDKLIEKNRLKEYRINNEEKIKKRQKDWRIANSDKIRDYQIIYIKENKDKINEYYRIKHNTDPLTKLKKNIRNRIRESLKTIGGTKNNKTTLILGCTFEEFKQHIESKFEPWMNWDNHGLYNGELNHGWDVDHIVPLSTAVNEDEVIKLNHFTNLQPLCSKLNRDIKR